MKAILQRWISEVEELMGGWTQPPACLDDKMNRLLRKLKEVEASHE